MYSTNPKVDFYFHKDGRWQTELAQLRSLVLECGLTEELKWGVPCYTLGKRNVVLIHVFKEYCAFLFFKGALMQDPLGMLVQQTENVQAARQIRFTGAQRIADLGAALKSYIFEAIEIEKAGLKVELKKSAEYSIPEEFERKLAELPELRTAFEALTPGRQRAYMLHFSAPKQSTTRSSRIEKSIRQIMEGKGLNDVAAR